MLATIILTLFFVWVFRSTVGEPYTVLAASGIGWVVGGFTDWRRR